MEKIVYILALANISCCLTIIMMELLDILMNILGKILYKK